jgi:hypothetical protein
MAIDHQSEKAHMAKHFVFQFMLIAVLPLLIPFKQFKWFKASRSLSTGLMTTARGLK